MSVQVKFDELVLKIPGDELRHLGRRSDGSTVPIVPDELYEVAAVQEIERSNR